MGVSDPMAFSVLIELPQYITGLGIAEFDDVFGNTLGGWIGVVVAYEWMKRNKAVDLPYGSCSKHRISLW